MEFFYDDRGSEQVSEWGATRVVDPGEEYKGNVFPERTAIMIPVGHVATDETTTVQGVPSAGDTETAVIPVRPISDQRRHLPA